MVNNNNYSFSHFLSKSDDFVFLMGGNVFSVVAYRHCLLDSWGEIGVGGMAGLLAIWPAVLLCLAMKLIWCLGAWIACPVVPFFGDVLYRSWGVFMRVWDVRYLVVYKLVKAILSEQTF